MRAASLPREDQELGGVLGHGLDDHALEVVSHTTFGADGQVRCGERRAALFEPAVSVFDAGPVQRLLEVEQQHIGPAGARERAQHGGTRAHVGAAEQRHEHDRPCFGRLVPGLATIEALSVRRGGIWCGHVCRYLAAAGCSRRAKKRSMSLIWPASTSTSPRCNCSSGLG